MLSLVVVVVVVRVADSYLTTAISAYRRFRKTTEEWESPVVKFVGS